VTHVSKHIRNCHSLTNRAMYGVLCSRVFQRLDVSQKHFTFLTYITALSTVTLYSPGDIRTNEFRLFTSLIFTLRPTSFTRYRSWKYRLCRHVCDPSCPRHDCLQRSENACTCRAMRNLSSGAVATIALWKSAPMATARI